MVLQRSWVQISYGPEFFLSLILTTSSVVFIAARIAYISIDIFIEFASIFKKKEVGNHKLKKLCKIKLLHSYFVCYIFLENYCQGISGLANKIQYVVYQYVV